MFRDLLSRRLVSVSGILIVCGALMMIVTAASAATPVKKQLTPLQRGLQFYKGQTITFIAPTAAGSGNDIQSRAEVKEMSQYLL